MGQSNENQKNLSIAQNPNNNLCTICKRPFLVMNLGLPNHAHNQVFICKPCLHALYLQIMNQTQNIPSLPLNCNSCKAPTIIYFPGQEFYQVFYPNPRSVNQIQRTTNFIPQSANYNNSYFSQNINNNPLQAQFMNSQPQKVPPKSAYPAFRNVEGIKNDEKNQYILNDKYKNQLDNIIKEMVRDEEKDHEEFLKSYSGGIHKNKIVS